MIMALNTVKCSNCNIVISELLAFVQNKADVMDEDSIIRLCNTAFKSEEIVTAKKLLFESMQTSSRNINRKGDGKEKRDMEDILCIIKETDPECLPVFVARDLHRLPPVTFDHLDASRLLKDIIMLQHDIAVIKDSYVTKDMVKVSSPEVKNFVNNRRRGAGLMESFDCESGPIGLPHISSDELVEVLNSTNNNSQVPQYTNKSVSHRPTPKHRNTVSLAQSLSVTRAPGETGLAEARNSLRDTLVSTEVAKQNDTNSYAEAAAVVSGVTPGTMQAKTNEWTLVQRKRNKNKFIGKKGTADVTSEYKFKAANINIPFYIYNVSKDCSATDITAYIKCKTGVEVNLDKMDMKQKKDYEAYKFMIPKDKLSIFMNENLWPSGISFRRYVTYNKTWNKGDNHKSSVINSEQK